MEIVPDRGQIIQKAAGIMKSVRNRKVLKDKT